MRWIGRAAALLLLALSGCDRSDQSAAAATIPHPDRRDAQIEYFQERPDGPGPWPTIVLLHGHQEPMARIGGRAYVDWGVLRRFASQGYLAVAVSLPGYGRSSGPEDFAGPYTQHAVQAVIARLKADHSARPDKVLIEGVSLGAVTGALVAAHDRQIAGLVLISGLYDLPAFLTDPKSPAARAVKAALRAQAGDSAEAMRARSALPLASQIQAATLIMNGAMDDRTDPNQAQRLADAINASGGRAQAHIYPGVGHEIPVAMRDAEIDGFIAATLRQ